MPVEIADQERQSLEKLIQQEPTSKMNTRIQIILALNAGQSAKVIASKLKVSSSTIYRWQKAWLLRKLDAFGLESVRSPQLSGYAISKSLYSPDEIEPDAFVAIHEGLFLSGQARYGATIRIWEEDTHEFWFDYHVSVDEQQETISNEVSVPLTIKDISEIRRTQNIFIDQLASLVSKVDIDKQDLRTLLDLRGRKDLVALASRIFTKIFLFGQDNPLRKLGEALLNLANTQTVIPPNIEIHTSSFFIAWQYLYLCEDYEKASKEWNDTQNTQQELIERRKFLERFWGTRFVTSIRPYASVSELVKSSKPKFEQKHLQTPLKFGLIYDIANKDIRATVREEIEYLKNRPSMMKVVDFFDHVDLPNPSDVTGTAAKFLDFLSNRNPIFNVIYMACHAGIIQEGEMDVSVAEQHVFTFGKEENKGYFLTILDLSLNTHGFENPVDLVIVNACSTSSRPLESAFSLVNFFRQMGTDRLIVTESRVNSRFASRFMCTILDQWIEKSKGIGEVLFIERRRLLNGSSSTNQFDLLLSFAYVLYVPSDLKHSISQGTH